jgi:hypothetical protein
LWKNVGVDFPLEGPYGRQYTSERRRQGGNLARQAERRWLELIVRLTLRAVVNPRLALDLLRLAWAFRADQWYARPPFLPLPPREYLRWRMYTAYGDEQAIPPAEDIIRFATWRRRVMHL